MRALAHPTRMRLIEELTLRGPMTATQAAAYVGESPSSCSFHLRTLAKYGFVEEAPGGTGRQRPWRAVSIGHRWSSGPGTEASARAASDTLAAQVWRRDEELLAEHLAHRDELPDDWTEAVIHSNFASWMTPDELAAIGADAARDVAALPGPAARPLEPADRAPAWCTCPSTASREPTGRRTRPITTTITPTLMRATTRTGTPMRDLLRTARLPAAAHRADAVDVRRHRDVADPRHVGQGPHRLQRGRRQRVRGARPAVARGTVGRSGDRPLPPPPGDDRRRPRHRCGAAAPAVRARPQRPVDHLPRRPDLRCVADPVLVRAFGAAAHDAPGGPARPGQRLAVHGARGAAPRSARPPAPASTRGSVAGRPPSWTPPPSSSRPVPCF